MSAFQNSHLHSTKTDQLAVLFDFNKNEKVQLKNKAEWIEFVDRLKSSVLGDDYQLDITLLDEITMADLNHTWREKNYPTDVLSFPYSKNEGEMFLCPAIITKKYKDYGRSAGNFTLFLVVHSLYHLRGLNHGLRMSLGEFLTRRIFGI